MNNFLFCFFEGAHDANYFARILTESGEYCHQKERVSKYPNPINKFLQGLYEESNPDDITVGKPEERLTPIIALRSLTSKTYLLGFVTGGCDRVETATAVLDRLSTITTGSQLLQQRLLGNANYSILFVYDADSRGIAPTIQKFHASYATTLDKFGVSETPAHNTWVKLPNISLAVYVFCDGTGLGTLEDNLHRILHTVQEPALSAATAYLDAHSTYLGSGAVLPVDHDVVAHRARKRKAIFTIAGQREKKLVGTSLSVILRDSEMLKGAFDLRPESGTSAAHLITLVRSAF